MYYLYILLCADNSFYTGITNNVTRRLLNHKLGVGSQYVRMRLPFRLLYTKEFPNKYLAAKRERQIKGWRRQKKISILGLQI